MRRRFFLAAIGLLGAACAAFLACSTSIPPPPAADAGAPEADGGGGSDAPTATGTFDGSLFPTGDATPGGPCEASTDCPPNLLCMYPVAEGCSATGVCTVLAAAECAGPYCTCRGDTTAACGAFGQLPMELPLHGPPCGSTSDDAGHD